MRPYFRANHILSTLLMLAVASLSPSLANAEAPLIFSLRWGSAGSGPGQFDYPYGIAASPTGDIYVTDTSLNRTQQFSSSGVLLCTFGSSGSGNGQFNGFADIAFGADNTAFASDNQNGRIQVIAPVCTYARQWSLSPNGPARIEVDRLHGFVYTTAGRWVFQFDTLGTYIGVWPWLNYSASFPPIFSVGPSGKLYFPDPANSKIRVFLPGGMFAYEFGEQGGADGQISDPPGVTTDSNENVYVVDSGWRIQKFTSTGTYLTSFGSRGSGDGQFEQISDMCTDAAGNFYLLEFTNHRVQKWTPSAQTASIRTSWGRLKTLYRTK